MRGFFVSLSLSSALSSAGCDGDGEHACLLYLLTALTGDIRDREGNSVTPDRVERVGPGITHVECYVRSGGYACDESTTGKAHVIVTLGEQTWTEAIVIRGDKYGCHNAEQELDFELASLTPCGPAHAVEGALTDEAGAPLVFATMTLQRLGDRNFPLLTPETHCEIEQGRYRCPAINYYSDAEFELTLQTAHGWSYATLAVRAEGCQVETVQHDIDLRTATIEDTPR